MNQQQQINFLKELIQCESVTPNTNEPIDLIIKKLSDVGFICEKLVWKDEEGRTVTNLYAHYGNGEENLCFAGHVDVVPTGDIKLWDMPAFEGIIKDEKIFGRGAVDMKGGLSSCIAAAIRYVKENSDKESFKISFLISGDEEWESHYGTIKLLEWLKKNNQKISACIISEPTSQKKIGDIIKNGSRGSLLFDLTIKGTQGHVAYHRRACNPITILVNILHDLKKLKLDDGTEFFEPSNLEVTDLEVNNKTSNLIPALAHAKFCIRFNDIHSQKSLSNLIHATIKKYTNDYSLAETLSGDAYKVDDEKLIKAIKNSIKETLNFEPIISANGATSDARFIKNICPVIELGPSIETAHKKNEHVALDDLFKLTEIFCKVIEKFFVETNVSHKTN
jgi:succinyl-diaminopimelate desuccinylase